jgi:hypothetical protein
MHKPIPPFLIGYYHTEGIPGVQLRPAAKLTVDIVEGLEAPDATIRIPPNMSLHFHSPDTIEQALIHYPNLLKEVGHIFLARPIQHDYDEYLRLHKTNSVDKPSTDTTKERPDPPWSQAASPYRYYRDSLQQQLKDSGEYVEQAIPVNYENQRQRWHQTDTIHAIADIRARMAVREWYTTQLGYSDELFFKVTWWINAIERIDNFSHTDLYDFNSVIERRELACIDLLLKFIQRYPRAEDDILATLKRLFEILADND